MIKKRFLCCLCLAIFTAVSLFGFTACSNNQDVLNRLDALESDMDALEAKVDALEAANANFQQQLAALDTSSDTFADDLAELTSNYNSLAANVQNATHIERVVVKEEDIGVKSPIQKCLLPKNTTDGKLVVNCRIEYSTPLFHYQLLTCKVSVNYNQQTYDINVYLSRADANENTPTLNGATATDILVDDVDNVTILLKEIVLYQFN